jgi:hypothetical protein
LENRKKTKGKKEKEEGRGGGKRKKEDGTGGWEGKGKKE